MHDCYNILLFYFAIMKTKRQEYCKTINKNEGFVKILANIIFFKISFVKYFLPTRLKKPSFELASAILRNGRWLKVHKHEIFLNFFGPKSNPYMPLVNFRKNFA
jgi:hypothetical protein